MDKPTDWPKALPKLQAALNSSPASATTLAPNEVLYGFLPNQALDLLSTATAKIATARITASNAIAFAQIAAKFHYDRHHQPIFLQVGDWALIRLHKGYSIPSTIGVTHKLSQQYVGPYQVTRRIGRLAYELGIPDHWRVHPVFTIAQLEPVPPPDADPFNRAYPDQPDSVHVEGDTEQWRSWEIDRLLNKKTTPRGRGFSTEYLVR